MDQLTGKGRAKAKGSKERKGRVFIKGKGLPKKVLETVIKKPASQAFRVFHGIHIINKSDCLPSKQEDVCHENLYKKILFTAISDDARDNRLYHNDGKAS